MMLSSSRLLIWNKYHELVKGRQGLLWFRRIDVTKDIEETESPVERNKKKLASSIDYR